jgi:hypothetical protein
MATRATYEFNSNDSKTTVYIHWDGYPTGAAVYFYNMIMNTSKGDLATQFIRANKEAEITESHERHGDTEYQYTITGNDLHATIKVSRTKVIAGFNSDIRYNSNYFEGSLLGFIEQEKELIKDYKPFREVNIDGLKALMNETTARQNLNDKHGPLDCYKACKAMNDGSHKWSYMINQIKTITEAFPEIKEELTEDLKKLLV